MRACVLSGLLLVGITAGENSQAARVPPGPNLLANPSFENGLQNWTVKDPQSVDWIPDYEFRPPNDTGLGAAALFNNADMSQCVPVFAGTAYVVSVWAFGSCADSAAIVAIDWYDDESCSVSSGLDFVTIVSKSNEWELTSKSVQSTSSANSAAFRFGTATCEDAIVVDDARFITDEIFVGTFDG